MLVALPDNLTPVSFADWMELTLLFTEHQSISQTEALDLLQDFLQFEEPDEFFENVEWDPDTEDEEVALREQLRALEKTGTSPVQQLVEESWQELAGRSELVGTNYPFGAKGSAFVVERRPVVYKFLTLLGARLLFHMDEAKIPTGRPARLFELVVTAGMGRLVDGRAIRFGWPHRAPDLGHNFRKAVSELCRLMGEDIGKHKGVPPEAKDHCLDVVAWRPFLDGQPSQPVILCQCAIGSDWTEKHIDIDRWNKDVIEFANRPQNALAFVVHMSAQKSHDLIGAATVGGLLLDRCRIASLVTDEQIEPNLLTQLNDWVEQAWEAVPKFGEARRRAKVKKRKGERAARAVTRKRVAARSGR